MYWFKIIVKTNGYNGNGYSYNAYTPIMVVLMMQPMIATRSKNGWLLYTMVIIVVTNDYNGHCPRIAMLTAQPCTCAPVDDH